MVTLLFQTLSLCVAFSGSFVTTDYLVRRWNVYHLLDIKRSLMTTTSVHIGCDWAFDGLGCFTLKYAYQETSSQDTEKRAWQMGWYCINLQFGEPKVQARRLAIVGLAPPASQENENAS